MTSDSRHDSLGESGSFVGANLAEMVYVSITYLQERKL